MIPASEFETRKRLFRLVKSTEFRCRACGEEVATEQLFERRDNGEPWVDPFQADGIEMFLRHHPLFCKARPPWWRRPFTRFKGYESVVTIDQRP